MTQRLQPKWEDLPDILTTADIQAYLRIGRRQAYEAVKHMHAVKIGKTIRIPKQSLQEYMRGQGA